MVVAKFAGFDALDGQSRHQAGRQQRNPHQARKHPGHRDDTADGRFRRLVTVTHGRHGHDGPVKPVTQRHDRGFRTLRRGMTTFDQPHHDADQNQHCQAGDNQGAQLCGSRDIGLERGKRAFFLAQRHRYPRPVSGIGKIHAFLPFRRDRDRADRSVETALLETAQNRFHFRDRDQLELPFQPFGDPAPKVHADAGNRTVRVHISVGRHVINGDTKLRGLGRLGANSARHRRDEPGAEDKARQRNRKKPTGRNATRQLTIGSAAGNHERSVKWAVLAKRPG